MTTLPRLPAKPILILIALMTLTACETMEGLGRDVQQTGAVIEDESQDAQAGM